MLEKENELLVEFAHARGSHHFRARATSIKSSLFLFISDKDIMSHLRVRALHQPAAGGQIQKLRGNFDSGQCNSLDESNLKTPNFFFLGLKAPQFFFLGRRARRGPKIFFWVARQASGRATTRGFKTSRSEPRGFRMSWRGARGFKMSSPGARGFSRGAQGVQVNPLNPLPVAPC